MKQKFSTLSIVTTALTLPISILVGSAVSFWLKRANADGVDITNGLAYTKPVLTSGIVVFIVLILMSFLLALVALKKDENKELAKRSLSLIGVLIVIVLSIGILQNRTSQVEKTYQQKQLKTFFQQLSK